MIGKQNAAVFPEPVCAHAIRSRPARPIGIEYLCTGVGFVYLHLATLAMRAGPRSTSVNVEIGSGTFSPVASTGMSSYASKLMPVFCWAWNSESTSALARASDSKGFSSLVGWLVGVWVFFYYYYYYLREGGKRE